MACYKVYELLSANVTVNLANVGLDANLTFPIPYNGENPILNQVIGTDYTAINSFVPSFILNIEGDAAPSTADGERYVDEIFSDNVHQMFMVPILVSLRKHLL